MAVQIGITDKGDRIWLKGPYHETYPACKEVPGARWAPKDKVWTYPLSMTACRNLRKTFGDRLEIGAGLLEWAKAEVSREKGMAQRGRATDGELHVLPTLFPATAAAMERRTYQKAGARFIADGRIADVFDEPGLGKTVMALAGIVEAGLWKAGTYHLVIAPKTAAQSTWPAEFRKWTSGAHVYAIPLLNTQAQRKALLEKALKPNQDGPVFIVVNPDMVRIKLEEWCPKCSLWEKEINESDAYMTHITEDHKTRKEIVKQDYSELTERVWDSVIADECHKYMLKIRPGSAKAKMPQWAVGLMSLKTTPEGLRIPLTGTPFRGKEYNMFGILHWTDPKTYSSFWTFVDNFLNKSDNGYGIDIGGLREDAREEFDTMMSGIALRRTRREVRKDLPEQMIIDHWVPLAGAHRKQYMQFVDEGCAELESGSVEGLGVLSQITRMRQFSFGVWDDVDGKLRPKGASPKLDLLVDMLDERGINAESERDRAEGKGDPEALKVCIGSQFVEILEFIRRELAAKGIECMAITGKEKNRAQTVEEFSTPGGPRVLLLSITAGGESITLDEYCEEMIILDETHVEDEMVQLRGRIDNRGDKVATRMYHYIRTEETIEEGIAQSNIDQADMQAALLDRRRGVDVAVRLLRRAS